MISRLKEISKGHWFGLPYGSYHHPRFTITGATFKQRPSCQRDTKERFDKCGVTSELLKGKSVLDIGCNTGAILLYAMQLGAECVTGLDNNYNNVDFCNTLFECLNYNRERYYFIHEDVNKLDKLPRHDVVFCLALSKWVDYDHLIGLLSKSKAELIWFEDNKHMGKIVKDIIPGYDCEFVWFSGPEANTPVGWKRVNYLCRRKQ